MAVIFYFSGTGNSLDAAKQAAAALPDCRLESMTAYLSAPYKVEDDVIGIVNPVYCMDLPPFVQKFLRTLEARTQYCFAIVTMGSTPGRALKHAQLLLQERGVQLVYAAAVAMPDNFFGTPQSKAITMLTAADKALTQIATHIHERRHDTGACVESFFWKNIGVPAGWWCMSNIMQIGTLSVEGSKCIGCGKCARLCPSGNIIMDGGMPHFSDKCAVCYACLRWCPEHALRMGGKSVNAAKNYTNPNIKVQELFN